MHRVELEDAQGYSSLHWRTHPVRIPPDFHSEECENRDNFQSTNPHSRRQDKFTNWM